MAVPQQSQAQTTNSEAAYRAVLIELISALQKQIAFLQAELNSRQAPLQQTSETATGFSGSVDVVGEYNISSVSDVSLIANRSHRNYFERVFELLPSKYDNQIKKVLVFDGKKTEFDAFVETIPPKHESWLYAVNEEIIADEDSDSNTQLIVHELAHIVSYQEIIGIPKSATAKCEAYFKLRGCPADNSYLRQFVNKFWSDSDLNKAQKFAESNNSSSDVSTHYKQNKDKFVTSYAATAPEEDFAESFMFYVTGKKSGVNSEALSKINFFLEYQNLIEARAYIQSKS